MKSFRLAIVLSAVMSCLCQVSAAQNIIGSTTLDIDPNSGNVTATCETDLDATLQGTYQALVSCSVMDTDGNVVASGTAGDPDGEQGYAQAVLTFLGIPGTTYTARGHHGAIAIFIDDNPDDYTKNVYDYNYYYDPYNFSSFEGAPIEYPVYNDWYGPGPTQTVKLPSIHVGSTTDNKIRYYTQSELQALIANAQAILSPHCDAVFAQVIVPTYTNANFFNSLRVTAFLQYPPGAPNIPESDGRDADTQVDQPGRPIELFPNFYPTKYGFPAGFQESVLTHEGVHHYTGWLDFHDPNNPLTPDFQTQFYSSGYRNTSGGSGDFSTWITAGCPAAP